MKLFKKTEELKQKYQELEQKISDPEIINNKEEFQKISKEYSKLKFIFDKYFDLQKLQKQENDTKEMLANNQDPELQELATQEINEIKEKISKIELEIQEFLLPEDPNENKNVIVEIRAGTGGEEASLFAADLFRMYSRYIEKKKWKLKVIDLHASGLKGYKEIIFIVEGKKAYRFLKFEKGVHRVQRVPDTETNGRIHTSAVSIVILPEIEEKDIKIDPKDLKIDVFRSGGKGGQSVNTTDSAVRITHLPTKIVVQCQDERSQMQNKIKAMRVLLSRLSDLLKTQEKNDVDQNRKGQVGTGDRSEKIRTYNYPQNRITDHRINLTLYNLDMVMDGEIDKLIDALIIEEQKKQVENL